MRRASISTTLLGVVGGVERAAHALETTRERSSHACGDVIVIVSG